MPVETPRLPLHRRIKHAGIPLLSFLSRVLYFAYMRLVLATSKVDAPGVAFLRTRQAAGKDTILAMLHQDVGAAPALLRDLPMASTVVNRGDAGDVLVGILDRCGISALRGGASKRASRRAPILRRLVGKSRRERGRGFVTLVPPDGPYGPPGACKDGVAMYAILARTEVCCLRISASPAWYLPTWDRAMVPLPFGRIRIDCGAPFVPPTDATRKNVESLRLDIEDSLHRMHREWFASLDRGAIPTLARLHDSDDLSTGSRSGEVLDRYKRTDTPRAAR